MNTDTENAPKKRRSSPRRFNSVEQIEREIDRAKTDALLADTEADAAEKKAYDLMKAGATAPAQIAAVKTLLAERDNLREKSRRLQGPVTDRLKKRIGIMRTIAPTELLGADTSIPRS